MSKLSRVLGRLEASMEQRQHEDVPAGPRLRKITIWVWRLILVLSLGVGANSLALHFTIDKAVAVLFGVLVVAWLVVEIWTRRVDWKDADIHRWVAIMLIAGSALGLASFMLTYNGIEKNRFVFSMTNHSNVAGTANDSMWSYMLGHHGGRLASKYGDVFPLHRRDDSLIEIYFANADTCRAVLLNHPPSTTFLTKVEIGDEVFEGWPRKEMLHEHCARTIKLHYSREKN